MKKLKSKILLIALVFASISIAQSNDSISNSLEFHFSKKVGKKPKKIKAGRSIVVWTEDSKYSGKLTIHDEQIDVDGTLIDLNSIRAVRKPRKIIGYTMAGIFGFFTFAFTAAEIENGGWGGILLIPPVAILTGSSVKYAIGRKFRTTKGWKFFLE